MIRVAICICFCSCFVLSSCQKEKLDGEITALLVGEWEWVRTETKEGFQVTTFTPETEGKEVSLKFYEKGKLQVLNNGDCHKKHRIKRFLREEEMSSGRFRYHMDLSKEKEQFTLSIDTNGNVDTLTTSKDDMSFFNLSFDVFDETTLSYFIRK